MVIVDFILAALGGISLGSIKGGGAILAVPVVMILLSAYPLRAMDYSLFIAGTASGTGNMHHYRTGHAHIKTPPFLGLSTFSTGFVASTIAGQLEPSHHHFPPYTYLIFRKPASIPHWKFLLPITLLPADLLADH